MVALENEQWDKLPGGVFNRGFVRAVAHHLGLDEESLLAEYSLATGDRGGPSASMVRPSPMPESRGLWLTWILIFIVAGGLALGGIYGWRKYAAHKRKIQPATTQQSQMIIRTTKTA